MAPDNSWLLTATERDVLSDLGRVADQLAFVVGDGPTRRADLAELYPHIHAVQNAVLAQAAARAYPGHYRLLGELLPPGMPDGERVPTDGGR